MGAGNMGFNSGWGRCGFRPCHKCFQSPEGFSLNRQNNKKAPEVVLIEKCKEEEADISQVYAVGPLCPWSQ
jgi:hypothetical protein